jgi:hypothetical protein
VAHLAGRDGAAYGGTSEPAFGEGAGARTVVASPTFPTKGRIIMSEIWVIERKEGLGRWRFYEARDTEPNAEEHLARITSHIAMFRKRRFVPAEAR